MKTIIINHEENDTDDLADYLRVVADSIDKGNTSGMDWDTEGESEEILECQWCLDDYKENNSDAPHPKLYCTPDCENYSKEANPDTYLELE